MSIDVNALIETLAMSAAQPKMAALSRQEAKFLIQCVQLRQAFEREDKKLEPWRHVWRNQARQHAILRDAMAEP